MTHYERLGVARTATAAELKAAYHRLALKLHPDRGGDPGTFAALGAAWATLRDPAARADYDRELALVDIAEEARQGADEVIADLTPTAERVGGRIAQTAVRRAAGLLSRLGLHAEVPPEIDALSDRLTRGAVRRGAEALRAKLRR